MSLDEQEFAARLVEVEARLGYPFRSRALLAQALTHRSFTNEAGMALPDNERLEFMGDAVLELVVSERLFQQFGGMCEGELSRARAALVRASSLARVATAWGLGAVLRLGKGETTTGGRDKRSLLADALEAVVGAVYLDGGIGPAAAVAVRLLGEGLTASAEALVEPDPKSKLQEWAQRRGLPTPRYVVVEEEGPEHLREFTVEVRVGERGVARASGRSKKEAALRAAMMALRQLEREARAE